MIKEYLAQHFAPEENNNFRTKNLKNGP